MRHFDTNAAIRVGHLVGVGTRKVVGRPGRVLNAFLRDSPLAHRGEDGPERMRRDPPRGRAQATDAV